MSKETKSEFYERHMDICKGKKCENCGRKLYGSHSEVAHIFEKSSFPEIALEDDNILYLCSNFIYGDSGCHDEFDSSLYNLPEMEVWEKVLDRFELLKPLIVKIRHKKYNYINNNYENTGRNEETS